MFGLKVANIQVNRKMLAELAIFEAEKFAALCDSVKEKVNAHYDAIKAHKEKVNAHYDAIKAQQLKDHEAKVAAEAARKEAVAKARELRNADK